MAKPQKNVLVRGVQAPVDLVAGATYPLQALIVLVRNPQLWGYVLVPMLLNIVVGIALYVGLLLPGLERIDRLTLSLSDRLTALIAKLPHWLSWLGFSANVLDALLQVLLVLGLLLLTGFVLVQFGTILGSPWYGQLSEQLEKLRLGRVFVPEEGLGGIFRDIWRALVFELKKLILAASLGVLLLLLNFVPGIGTALAGVGGVTIAALIFCLDFLDAPLERRRLRFRDKLGIVLSQFPASGSFSVVCLSLVTLPVVNFITIPLCVAGGTLFFCDRIWSDRFGAEADGSKP